MTFPIPDGLDDAVAAAAWDPGLSAWPMDVITGVLPRTAGPAIHREAHTDIGEVTAVSRRRSLARDQQGRRPVFIP